MNTFEKSQAAKVLACYTTSEELGDIEKGQKYKDKYIGSNGKWVYVYANVKLASHQKKHKEISSKLQDLQSKRKQLEREMELNPDVEGNGGKVADSYGDKLGKFDAEIEGLTKTLRSLNLKPTIHEESNEYVPASLLQLKKSEEE